MCCFSVQKDICCCSSEVQCQCVAVCCNVCNKKYVVAVVCCSVMQCVVAVCKKTYVVAVVRCSVSVLQCVVICATRNVMLQ